jgi:sulfite reductase beta subunit-like hemoprotein
MAWGLGDVCADPGEVLLRLVTQSAARAERYAAELERLVAEKPALRDALVGDAYGEGGKTGEYVRGIARLEAEERDRCASFATKAIAAGLAERQVRLAERQGALIAGVIQAILGDLRLTAEQQLLVPTVVPNRLREITGSAA